jgi:acid phosphatase
MKSGMPYLYSLARHYAYAKNYHATRHPSLPNYLAIAGGDTFGVHNDAVPAAHRLRGATVFGQAIAKRRHARLYAESMPRRCTLTGNANRGYAVKHNPWAYFPAERGRCRSFDVSETGFRRAAKANALPEVGMLIPNKCHDAHDCRLRTADGWLRSRLPVVLASRDFRSGRLVVVITADEDDSHSGNKVLTVVLHPRLAGSHLVVGTALNHYSLSRLYSQAVGARPLRHAARARSMSAAFGLRVGP